MKPVEQRTAEANERIERIGHLLKNNGNASDVAELLRLHYHAVAMECMAGLTPSPVLKDHWDAISFKFGQVGTFFKQRSM